MYWNYVSDYKARESRTVHHFMAFLSMKIQTFLTVTLYPRLQSTNQGNQIIHPDLHGLFRSRWSIESTETKDLRRLTSRGAVGLPLPPPKKQTKQNIKK
jgi:hypothetical protein